MILHKIGQECIHLGVPDSRPSRKPGKLVLDLPPLRQAARLLFSFVVAAYSCAACSRETPGSLSMRSDDLIIDGSSTVYPIVSAMADDFSKSNPGLNIIVNKSGTGSGLQKFGREEIDIAAASRPIDQAELAGLAQKNIQVLEIPFAMDGVCVIVNRSNTWATTLKLSQLQLAWQRNSPVKRWSDLNPAWPQQKVSFYGPTDNHGTYDYFAEAVAPGSSLRTDVQTNQEYNAIVQAVTEDPDGIGYVGLAYYIDNSEKLRACAIDFGSGPIAPNSASVAGGAYAVLSRPLLLYVSKFVYDHKISARKFVKFALSKKGADDVSEAHYVKLSDLALKAVSQRIRAEKLGTAFSDKKLFSPDRLIEAESRS